MRKGFVVHTNNYSDNNSEYFLSAYEAAHTLLSLVLCKYSLIFYPKNEVGSNFTRILQNEETEAQRFIHLLVHTPLTDTKVKITSQAFKSRPCVLTTG